MAWAQKPAGALLFRHALPKHVFLGFCFVFSGFSGCSFRNGFGTKTCWGSAVSHARPKHLFLEFGLVACRFFSLFLVGSKSNVSAVFWLRFSHGFGPYFFLFNGFQQRRFGIFSGCGFRNGLGTKTCWGSAFSHARPKHLFLEFGLVACRLPSLTLRKRFALLEATFFLCF